MRTFSFFIHTTNSLVPALLFELSSDEITARLLAEKALAESPDGLLVEVREDDKLLLSLDRNGVSWTNPESRLSKAKQTGARPGRIVRQGRRSPGRPLRPSARDRRK
jgi:hypothetical protein